MTEEIKYFYLDNVNKFDFIKSGTKLTKFVHGAKKKIHLINLDTLVSSNRHFRKLLT